MKAIKIYSVLLFATLFYNPMLAQTESAFLKDRGSGIATSMFGTYMEKGDIIFYPFYEYYYDKKAEYNPEELGYNIDGEFFAKSVGHEGLIYLGYGISDWVMIEMEAAVISEEQHKAANDSSNFPTLFKEDGLGDVEGQIRWRYWKETDKKPELFSYWETVLPLNKDKKMIGTQDWEFKFGSGLIKGFDWGTVTVRSSVEYSREDEEIAVGEFALEYLNRVSDFFRFMTAVEGNLDEQTFIADLQFHLTPWMFIRINNAFGINDEAEDYAPEFGALFYLNKINEKKQ